MMGNPVNTSNGNKYEVEPDYQGTGQFPLRFVRHYNSMESRAKGIGKRWAHTFDRMLTRQSTTRVKLFRDDGEVLYFNQCGVAWCASADESGALIQMTSAPDRTTRWKFTDENDVTEEYDGLGRLLSVTNRAGMHHVLSYDTKARLSAVTDSFGHAISLTYDASNRISQLTDPAGGTIVYAYDGSGNLSSVTYPDTSTRVYLYDEPAHVAAGAGSSLLTGIQDESGQRYATFQYDAQSRVVISEHAGGADRLELTYNANGTTATVDAAGASRTSAFQTIHDVNRIASISGPACTSCGSMASYSYNSAGDLTSTTDFNGNETLYSFNARHLEESRTEGYGSAVARTVSTTWHSTLRLPDVITEPGRTTDYDYDPNGNLIGKVITDTTSSPGLPSTWTYTYDSYGRVLTEDGPRTDVLDKTTYAYYTCNTGDKCGQLHTVTNAIGQIVTFHTYNAHGQPLTITDENSVLTALTYDLRQRVTSRTIGGETTGYEYWPTGLLKKVTMPDSSLVLYTYDAAHRLTKIEDAAGNRIEYVVDAMGNRTAEVAYDASNTLVRSHTQVFNTLNQLAQQIGSAGTAAVTTVFGYDDNGNLTSASAPLSRSSTNEYDELNRLKRTTDPEGGVTEFGYDSQDNLVSVKDPENLQTTYVYNGLGNLTSQTSPDTGVTGLTYDSAGNPQTRTDARGPTNGAVSYVHDALNRITGVAYPDQTATFTYDTPCSNGKGRLCRIEDGSGSTEYTYDAVGRVLQKTQNVQLGGSYSPDTRSVNYTYLNSKLTRLKYPDINAFNFAVDYGYDAAGRIASIDLWWPSGGYSTPVLSDVQYGPDGNVLGWTWASGAFEVREYDQDGRISLVDSAGAATLAHDDAGRITGITALVGSTVPSWSFSYDLMDRLTSAAGGTQTQSFTYDDNGNRLNQGGTPSGNYVYPLSSGGALQSNRLQSVSAGTNRSYQ